jgi:hypothetical protein
MKNDDEFSSSNRPEPADPAALAEATDIMSNPQNPRHSSFIKNDQSTLDHVSALYKRAYPGEVNLTADSPELQAAFSEPVQVEQPQEPVYVPAENSADVEMLRARWGNEFDATFQSFARGAHAVTEGNFTPGMDDFLRAHPEVADKLAEYGANLKGGR